MTSSSCLRHAFVFVSKQRLLTHPPIRCQLRRLIFPSSLTQQERSTRLTLLGSLPSTSLKIVMAVQVSHRRSHKRAYPLTLVSHSTEDATFLTISGIALGYRSLSFLLPRAHNCLVADTGICLPKGGIDFSGSLPESFRPARRPQFPASTTSAGIPIDA